MEPLPSLFRSFLPLENPIGFGYQDFLELGFAVILVTFSALRFLPGARWLRSPFASLLTALVLTHVAVTWWTLHLVDRRSPDYLDQQSPRTRERTNPDSAPPPAASRIDPGPKPRPSAKRASPFEEVK